MIKSINKLACYLIVLTPIFLVTGPFLPDLSIVIIDLTFLFIIFKEKKFFILNNKYFKFLIILWIYFSVRSLFAEDIFLSFKSSFFYLRFIFLIWAISFFLERNKNLFDKFSKFFMVVICFVILDAILQYITGTNILGFKIQTIIFSILFFLLNINLRKIIIISFLTILIGIVSLSQFSNKVSHSIYYNFFDPIRTIFFETNNLNNFDNKKIYMFTQVYDSHYNTAYNMYLDNKLFGVGTKMYRKLCRDEKYYVNQFSCTTHPHNFYFQQLAENGLIGFLGILIIFTYTLISLFKRIYYVNFKKNNIIEFSSTMILIGLFINFWPIVPSGNFFNNWLSVMIFFPIGFLKYFLNRKI